MTGRASRQQLGSGWEPALGLAGWMGLGCLCSSVVKSVPYSTKEPYSSLERCCEDQRDTGEMSRPPVNIINKITFSAQLRKIEENPPAMVLNIKAGISMFYF